MLDRKAFTLLEVLISIALMGIVLVALFSSVDLLQDSNAHLSKQLKNTKNSTQASEVLFMDILSSDGNLTISNDEYSRVCIESTSHSLYTFPRPKVCWAVIKENNTLVRVEGYGYTLPTHSDDRVEIDRVMQDIELFNVYHHQDQVLVLLKERSKKAIKFMLQGVSKPKLQQQDNNSTSVSDPGKKAKLPNMQEKPNKE